MVTPGEPIALADLQALAAKANAVLLPIVNAIIAQGPNINSPWPYTDYDYYFDWATPQPEYNFAALPVAPPVNLIPAGSVYDGNGNVTVNIPDPWGWYDIIENDDQAAFNVGGFLPMNNGRAQRATGGNQITLGGNPSYAGKPVQAQLFLNIKNWSRELNRIRADYFNLVFIQGLNDELYLDPATVASGPWIVGLNDPATFPMDQLFVGPLNTLASQQGANSCLGEFFGVTNGYPGFKNVKFRYAAVDNPNPPDALSIQSGVRNSFSFPANVTPGGGEIFFEIDFTASVAGALEMTIDLPFDAVPPGGPADPPSPADFTITNSSGVVITWFTIANPNYPAGPQYFLQGVISQNIPAADGVINLDILAPTGFGFDGAPRTPTAVARLILDGNTAAVPAQGLHFTSACQELAAADVPPNADFQVTFSSLGPFPTPIVQDSVPFWRISDPTVKGVWIANSWAAPAVNVFIDSDLPPTVNETGFSIPLFDATGLVVDVAQAASSGPPNPQASSMMMAVPLQPPAGPAAGPPWGVGFTGISPSPAAWLVRKDTDFTPYDLGWETQQGQMVNQFPTGPLPPGTTSVGFNFFVPPNATAVIVRALAAIDVGWPGAGQARAFQYGTPMAQPVTINFNPGTPGGFAKNNSQVTIPNDGGPGYLATILGQNVTISVTNPIANAAQAVQLYVEVQTQANPVRQYFPSAWEVFSFNLNDDVGFSGGDPNINIANLPKKIPQNGHCIYKLTATRAPAAVPAAPGYPQPENAGAAVTLAIGQNQLQAFNTLLFVPLMMPDNVTPLTITIPANEYSAELNVFLPVLGGNELVFQVQPPAGGGAATPVALIAHANWQPLFFQTYFALGLQVWALVIGGTERGSSLAFQYALNFFNLYDRTLAGYPPSQFFQNGTICQFPVPAALYNDLFALLNLI